MPRDKLRHWFPGYEIIYFCRKNVNKFVFMRVTSISSEGYNVFGLKAKFKFRQLLKNT